MASTIPRGRIPGGDSALANYGYQGYPVDYFLMNSPGAFFNYSDPNFSYVGLVTEELDDRPAWSGPRRPSGARPERRSGSGQVA